MAEEIKCTITKKIGVLSKKDNGYSKQINLVSWNEREAKLDIREWSPTDRGIKGICRPQYFMECRRSGGKAMA